jgi:hypothetical protein
MAQSKDRPGDDAEANLSGDNKVLIRRPQIIGDFGNMSAETSLGLAAAWAAAVGGLLLIMILLRMFS